MTKTMIPKSKNLTKRAARPLRQAPSANARSRQARMGLANGQSRPSFLSRVLRVISIYPFHQHMLSITLHIRI